MYHYKKPIQSKAGNTINELAVNTSTSFKYQSDLIKKQVTSVAVAQNIDPDVTDAHRQWKNVKITVSLKYISNFFRSLELPSINTKLYIELNWTKHSVIKTLYKDTATTYQITKTELYVPVVALKAQNNNKLTELLRKGSTRSVIWNEHKSKIQTVSTMASEGGNNDTKRILLDSSCQGANRLSVMVFDNNTVKRNNNDP